MSAQDECIDAMATTTSAPTRFTIAGDGIAGRAMALGLARAGFTATIIAPDADTAIEGGVQLAPNSWAALQHLQVDDAARDGAVPLSLMRMLSINTGHSLVQLGLNDRPRRSPYTSMTRAHLMACLRDAATATGQVSWINASLAEATTSNGRAQCTLDDGTTHNSDWLIGADSLNGACRHYVEAQDASAIPPDLIARRVAFRMVVASAELPPRFATRASTVWLGDGGHVVHYPLADGTVNIVAVVAQSPSARARVKRMLGAHASLTPLIPHLDGAREQPLFDHLHLDTYQRGRVVLAGDAAHPMPPHLAQGAGQSLIDAASLSQQLSRLEADDDLAPVFTRWTAERVRAIRSIRASADRAGAMFAMSGPMARLRNLGLSTFGGPMLERQLDELWSS
ncbi:MAG: FAD-dependent monooxygenase [Alphaproteobacteria bacterium]|nr:FAD-dependent monooxygenase [Alphaproteobacteria bacterium]